MFTKIAQTENKKFDIGEQCSKKGSIDLTSCLHAPKRQKNWGYLVDVYQKYVEVSGSSYEHEGALCCYCNNQNWNPNIQYIWDLIEIASKQTQELELDNHKLMKAGHYLMDIPARYKNGPSAGRTIDPYLLSKEAIPAFKILFYSNVNIIDLIELTQHYDYKTFVISMIDIAELITQELNYSKLPTEWLFEMWKKDLHYQELLKTKLFKNTPLS